MKSNFISEFKKKSQEIHETAKSKGWWEKDRNDAEIICLMHSELSEALEALRTGNNPSEHIPAFSGLEEELADIIIRIMDYSEYKKLKLANAIEAKNQFNKSREYKHGKLF